MGSDLILKWDVISFSNKRTLHAQTDSLCKSKRTVRCNRFYFIVLLFLMRSAVEWLRTCSSCKSVWAAKLMLVSIFNVLARFKEERRTFFLNRIRIQNWNYLWLRKFKKKIIDFKEHKLAKNESVTQLWTQFKLLCIYWFYFWKIECLCPFTLECSLILR